MTTLKFGAVIFTIDHARLAMFYAETTARVRQSGDATRTVLASDSFELVLHNLRGEPSVVPVGDSAAAPREHACVKLFFPVTRLAAARARCAANGGRVLPPEREWNGRGFRACDAFDPDGNVMQFRESAAG